MAGWIKTVGSWVRRLISALTGQSSAADEYRAQAELTEAQAFATSGRVSPRYVVQYVVAIIGGLAALAILVDAVWPDVLPGAPATSLSHTLGDVIAVIAAVL